MGGLPALIAAYKRTGHGHLADNESLEVDGDGTFRLRRTTGSSVAGAFAGTMPADRLAALQAAAAGVADEPGGDPPPSGRTIEYLATAEHGIALGSGSTPPPSWIELASVLRHLVLDLVDQPAAAVGAELVDGGHRLVIRQLGPEAIEVDPDSASISLEAIDEAGQRVGAWEAQLADLLPEVGDPEGDGDDDWERPPGWFLDVELPHDLPPGRVRGTLEIWIKTGDGSCTAALHLEAPVP